MKRQRNYTTNWAFKYKINEILVIIPVTGRERADSNGIEEYFFFNLSHNYTEHNQQ